MAGENRIETAFNKLKSDEKKAFIAFITAGDPDLETSLQLLYQLPQKGVDIIELGLPFSDPMADGPIIQASSLRAINNGITITNYFDMVRSFRRKDTKTPIIMMGYYNPIFSYGTRRFTEEASRAGIDGFIVVDLPPEEDEELRIHTKEFGINIIRLVAPTTVGQRLPRILQDAEGFIYYVSITGVTGSASPDFHIIQDHIDEIRTHTDLPIAIGFGIKTASDVNETAKISDAVVVGSSIVNKIGNIEHDSTDNLEIITDYIEQLAHATK
jgi:tryptophan synthase alpha chain